MNQIEKRARPSIEPLIKGLPIRVTERDQLQLATWLVLKTMVAELDDPARVTIHHMQRRRMFHKKIPPKGGWRIWIGHFDRVSWVPAYINNTFSIIPGSQPPGASHMLVNRYNTQSVTYVFGKLFVHLIHSPNKHIIRLWQFPPPVDGKLRQIWPLTGYSFVWPSPAMTERITGCWVS